MKINQKLPMVHHSSLLAVRHGFFTRAGGVSPAPYESLNGGLNTGDDPRNIMENREIMARFLGVEEARFLGVTQIHGADIVTIRNEKAGSSSLPSSSVRADGLVTDRSDIALTIATADCAPVLLSSHDGAVVGAAHAGWRGAAGGVLEETVTAMQALGAREIRAAIGPCIGPQSYEVASDMRQQLLAMLQSRSVKTMQEAEYFFHQQKSGRYLFDLPGFCRWRLKEAGVSASEILALDTLQGEQFFSYRRHMLTKSGPTGRQISAIRALS